MTSRPILLIRASSMPQASVASRCCSLSPRAFQKSAQIQLGPFTLCATGDCRLSPVKIGGGFPCCKTNDLGTLYSFTCVPAKILNESDACFRSALAGTALPGAHNEGNPGCPGHFQTCAYPRPGIPRGRRARPPKKRANFNTNFCVF